MAAAPAAAQEEAKRVLIYTGTTGYRHADAIDAGRPAVQTALEGLGYEVDWEDCDNNGGGANNCDNPNKNPRVFTDANLANYDAIFLLNTSAIWNGGGRPGPLWDQAQKDAIIRFVQQGGGIAANHPETPLCVWLRWRAAIASPSFLLRQGGTRVFGNLAAIDVQMKSNATLLHDDPMSLETGGTWTELPTEGLGARMYLQLDYQFWSRYQPPTVSIETDDGRRFYWRRQGRSGVSEYPDPSNRRGGELGCPCSRRLCLSPHDGPIPTQ